MPFFLRVLFFLFPSLLVIAELGVASIILITDEVESAVKEDDADIDD